MTQRISGPGLGLPLPQNLYPSELQYAAQDSSSNHVGLAPGDTFVVPAGDWYVNLGNICVLQYLDPVTNTWAMGPNAAWAGGQQFLCSDGFTTRVANLTGCPVSATVYFQGGGYTQASTTITAVGNNSTWLPIVGGALALSGGTIATSTSGAGYGIAPIVLIPPPPPAANNANGVGGKQATGWVAITGGTISGFTFLDQGAGYPAAPTVVVVPSPFDPNLSTGITQATLAFTLTNSGQITGVLCTNPGAALATPTAITLTVGGAGTNASLTANVMQTVSAVTVTGAGTGYGTLSALMTTVGGVPQQGSITSSTEHSYTAFRPRPAQIGLAVTAAANGTIAAQNGVIYDGGLFVTNAAPSFVILSQPTAGGSSFANAAATITMTMGSVSDTVQLQPAA
jgi:hypothetical protein